MNNTRLDVLKNSIVATLGLIVFGFGVYLVIQADIGVAPWDVFCIGLSQTLGILYGNASIMISATIIILDLIMKEKIGLGTILDAIVVGKTVDFFNWIDLIHKPEAIWVSIIMIIVGFFLEGVAQVIYMKAGLSCGPRDAFQVALGRRMPKIPIGVVNIFILFTVFIIGYFLGGPVGIGTLIAPIGIGLCQQAAFNITKFEPKDVEHQGFFASIKVLFGKATN